jgi:hypothetical protein
MHLKAINGSSGVTRDNKVGRIYTWTMWFMAISAHHIGKEENDEKVRSKERKGRERRRKRVDEPP